MSTTQIVTAENGREIQSDVVNVECGFFSLNSFELLQRVAKAFAASSLVPQQYQGNIANCMIGLSMAQRLMADPIAVFQSLYIVHGRPTWSAQFIIASLNSCGRFSPLRFEILGEGDDRVCYAWAIERGTNERLEGPPVSIQMAVREGWMGKNGSKWQTMPELMLRYRAATFFGRLYAPDILMGMRSDVEVYDEGPGEVEKIATAADDLNARFAGETIDVETGEVRPADATPEMPQEAEKAAPAPEPKPAPKERAKSKQEPQPVTQPEADASLAVKSFLRELNAKNTAMEVDQWRAKHHNRVANACGGTESDGFLQVIDYAEMRYRELVDAEKGA